MVCINAVFKETGKEIAQTRSRKKRRYQSTFQYCDGSAFKNCVQWDSILLKPVVTYPLQQCVASTQIQITRVQCWHQDLSLSSVGDGCLAGVGDRQECSASVYIRYCQQAQPSLQMQTDKWLQGHCLRKLYSTQLSSCSPAQDSGPPTVIL